MDLQVKRTVSRFVEDNVNGNDTNVVGNLLVLLIVYLQHTYMVMYEDLLQRAQLQQRVNCIWMFRYHNIIKVCYGGISTDNIIAVHIKCGTNVNCYNNNIQQWYIGTKQK